MIALQGNRLLNKVKAVIAEFIPQVNLTIELFSTISHKLSDLSHIMQPQDIQEIESENTLINQLNDIHHSLLTLMMSPNVDVTFSDIRAYQIWIEKVNTSVYSEDIIEHWQNLYNIARFNQFLMQCLLDNNIDQLNKNRLLSLIKTLEHFVIQIDFNLLTCKSQHNLYKVLQALHLRLTGTPEFKDELSSFKNIHQQLIQSNIGFDFYIASQDISVEINPLDEQLNIQPLKFSNAQEIGENFKGVVFRNAHIKSLELDLHSYGFEGKIDLSLIIDSPELHQEYLFLYHNQSLSIAVTLTQSYHFKSLKNTKAAFTETHVFHGLTHLENKHQNNSVNFTDIVSEWSTANEDYAMALPTLSLQYYFCDPFKALLSAHHPMRIAQNMSYNELFKALLSPFSNWLKLDQKEAKLLEAMRPQIFIFCAKKHRRSLYDFVIETLKLHQLNLVYDYQAKIKPDQENEKKSNKKTAIKIDPISQLRLYEQSNTLSVSKRSEPLPFSCTAMNLWYLQSIKVNIKNHTVIPAYQMNVAGFINSIDPLRDPEAKKNDKNKNSSNKQDSKKIVYPKSVTLSMYADESLAIQDDKSIYQAQLKNIQRKWTKVHGLVSEFHLNWSQLPLLEQAYPSIHITNFPAYFMGSIGQYTDKIQLANCHILIKQTVHTKAFIKNALLTIGDSQKDLKKSPKYHLEKLGCIQQLPNVTHQINVDQSYFSNRDNITSLPEYQPFIPVQLQGEVYTRKDVDPKYQYEYRFFVDKERQESAFIPDKDTKNNKDESKSFQISDIHDKSIMLAVSVNPGLSATTLLKPGSEAPENFIVYAPAKDQQPYANSYFAYANGDIVALEVTNPESIFLNKVVSNRVLPNQKGSEQFIQQTKYGLQQEAMIRYSAGEKDDELLMDQKQNQDQGFNRISFSKKNGLTLSFSSKKQTQ